MFPKGKERSPFLTPQALCSGPEQLQRLLPKCGISPPTPSTSSTAALTTPTTRLATFFTPLIKQVLVPNGRALASALFAVYGDIETSSTPSYSTATSSSSSCATAPPTPPRPTIRQPASAPPSPPSSTSPSSPPDTDSSQCTYIDLTNDDDHYDDNRGGTQQASHDGNRLQLGEHSHQAHEEEEEEDEDTEWAEQEQEESSEEAARRLERERSAAEREWREGPLAAALRESAFAPPTASSRPRAPDLLYDMVRKRERGGASVPFLSLSPSPPRPRCLLSSLSSLPSPPPLCSLC